MLEFSEQLHYKMKTNWNGIMIVFLSLLHQKEVLLFYFPNFLQCLFLKIHFNLV